MSTTTNNITKDDVSIFLELLFCNTESLIACSDNIKNITPLQRGCRLHQRKCEI